MKFSSAATGRVRGVGASLVLATFSFALGACDVPTSPPEWETT